MAAGLPKNKSHGCFFGVFGFLTVLALKNTKNTFFGNIFLVFGTFFVVFLQKKHTKKTRFARYGNTSEKIRTHVFGLPNTCVRMSCVDGGYGGRVLVARLLIIHPSVDEPVSSQLSSCGDAGSAVFAQAARAEPRW